MKLIEKIQENLTPDLLRNEYREGNKKNPLYGHCYVASEALFHLLGGLESGWFPVRARDFKGVVHWWLEDRSGEILDPTAGQYEENPPPYEKGKRGFFLTGEKPSKRAGILISRVQKDLNL